MPNKSYQTADETPLIAAEPAVAYHRSAPSGHSPAVMEYEVSNRWNPNVPFHGTQEELWEHFHRIEEGHFTPLEEANLEFELWKKEYLASRLK